MSKYYTFVYIDFTFIHCPLSSYDNTIRHAGGCYRNSQSSMDTQKHVKDVFIGNYYNDHNRSHNGPGQHADH